LSAFSGTGITYTPNPGFSGIDSFSYRGCGDVQPPRWRCANRHHHGGRRELFLSVSNLRRLHR
jgi:hypothetical protein